MIQEVHFTEMGVERLIPDNYIRNQYIASLGTGKLVTLENALDIPFRQEKQPKPMESWAAVVSQVRVERQRAVKEMRTFRPIPEYASYNAEEGPNGYIAQARQVLVGGHFDHEEIKRFHRDNPGLHTWADSFVDAHRASLKFPGARVKAEVLGAFFTKNLRSVMAAAQADAFYTYEEKRRETINKHMPGIVYTTPSQFFKAVQLVDATAREIADATEDVKQIPFQATFTDFMQLDTNVQEEIVKTFGQEWLALCELIARHHPALLRTAPNSVAALSMVSVADLQAAINSNPDLPPADICKAYMRSPQSLDQAVPFIRRVNAHNRAVHEYRRQPYQPQAAGLESVLNATEQTDNILAVQELISDVQMNLEAFGLEPGVTLRLSPEDKPIRANDFEDIVNKHVELIARLLYQAYPLRSPFGVILENFEGNNVGTFLQNNFSGTLRNLTVTMAPASMADLHAAFRYKDSERHMATQLAFSVERTNTGKKPVPTMARIILALRKSQDKPDVVYKSLYGKLETGQTAST